MIREWLRGLLAPPPGPDPNWAASDAFLEHLFEGRPQHEPDRDGRS